MYYNSVKYIDGILSKFIKLLENIVFNQQDIFFNDYSISLN